MYEFSQFQTLKQHWESGKTLKENLSHLGLAFNPNNDIKLDQRMRGRKKKLQRIQEDADMQDASNEKGI